jgi:hypothetical protein
MWLFATMAGVLVATGLVAAARKFVVTDAPSKISQITGGSPDRIAQPPAGQRAEATGTDAAAAVLNHRPWNVSLKEEHRSHF